LILFRAQMNIAVHDIQCSLSWILGGHSLSDQAGYADGRHEDDEVVELVRC
jgi:hypothetical protein